MPTRVGLGLRSARDTALLRCVPVAVPGHAADYSGIRPGLVAGFRQSIDLDTATWQYGQSGVSFHGEFCGYPTRSVTPVLTCVQYPLHTEFYE